MPFLPPNQQHQSTEGQTYLPTKAQKKKLTKQKQTTLIDEQTKDLFIR